MRLEGSFPNGKRGLMGALGHVRSRPNGLCYQRPNGLCYQRPNGLCYQRPNGLCCER